MDLIPFLNLQPLLGIALSHRDLQKASASDECHGLIPLPFPVSFFQTLDGSPFCPNHKGMIFDIKKKLFFINIADEIPKGIDVENLSYQPPFSYPGFFKIELYPGIEFRTKGFGLDTQGKVSCDWSEEVPSVERGT